MLTRITTVTMLRIVRMRTRVRKQTMEDLTLESLCHMMLMLMLMLMLMFNTFVICASRFCHMHPHDGYGARFCNASSRGPSVTCYPGAHVPHVMLCYAKGDVKTKCYPVRSGSKTASRSGPGASRFPVAGRSSPAREQPPYPRGS